MLTGVGMAPGTRVEADLLIARYVSSLTISTEQGA
jgi:hypothetical protein